MQQFRALLQAYWPKIALFGGICLLSFVFFGKFLLWFFAKAAIKVLGLILIGIGLIFGKFTNSNPETTRNSPQQ